MNFLKNHPQKRFSGCKLSNLENVLQKNLRTDRARECIVRVSVYRSAPKKLWIRHWYIRSTFFLNSNKVLNKIKQLLAKVRCLCKVHFVLPILSALMLASDREVWYGNFTFSILLLSTKKG